MTISTLSTSQTATVGHEQVLSGPELEQQEPNARMVQRSATRVAEFFSIVPADARLQVLDFMHLQPFLLQQQLANAESCPSVTGFSFKANLEHAGEIYPLGARGTWVENLSKFNQVRYLRFAGFHADIVLDAIYGWLQKINKLTNFLLRPSPCQTTSFASRVIQTHRPEAKIRQIMTSPPLAWRVPVPAWLKAAHRLTNRQK